MDAINTTGQKLFRYPRWITRVVPNNAPDPSPPEYPADGTIDPSEISTRFHAERVVQSAGGSPLDHCSIRWHVTGPLINRSQVTDFAQPVEVFLPDQSTRLFIGDYVSETESVNRAGETLTAEAHVRKWYFRFTWDGQLWWDSVTGQDAVINLPPIFNPIIDGRIVANRSNRKRQDGKDAYVWCHPEQLGTRRAQEFADQTAEVWTLKQAVQAMCWKLNPIEDWYISNPTDEQFDKLDGARSLENVVLPFDVTLPQALDLLLQPMNYNWFINYELTKPAIELFEVGNGPQKELRFQPPLEVLDLAKTNVSDYQVTRSIGDAPTAAYVVGDLERREITLPLYKAWDATNDDLTASDLTKAGESQYTEHPNVWRLWVANEGGDYTGLREEIGDPPDLTEVFTIAIPHRRIIEDPLTYEAAEDGSKQRRQIYLEWSSDAGETWQVVPPSFGQPFVMPDQIGVIFTGDTPPVEMISAGGNARMRITGVVAGDYRIESVARPIASAATSRENNIIVEAPDKFHDRRVQTQTVNATGKLDNTSFHSRFRFDPNGADEVNDSLELESYARQVRDQYRCVDMDCRFELPGIHLEYKIGDSLTKIAGREIDLNMCGSESPRYPQVIRREFDFSSGPRTILTVDRRVGRAPQESITPVRSAAFFPNY